MKYEYVFSADQKKTYYDTWFNFNIPVKVVATGYEEAKTLAEELLGPHRSDTDGWKVFLKSVTSVDDPQEIDLAPPVQEPRPATCRCAKKIRMRGIV